jgi:hypothetical protein
MRGDVYLSDTNHSLVKEIPYSGGVYGTPVAIGTGFNCPANLAVDKAGNVYVADYNHSAVKKIVSNGHGGFGATVTLGSGFDFPVGVAVDATGDVFVGDEGNGDVKEIPYSGGKYGTPIISASGLSGPRGLAVDSAGDIYVAVTGSNAVYKMPLVFTCDTENPYCDDTPNALFVYGTPVAVGAGFDHPISVTLDAAGELYVVDSGHNIVDALDFQGANVPGVSVGSSSTLPISMNFTFDSSGTFGAPRVVTQGAQGLDFADSSVPTAGLGANGQTLTVGVNFKPTVSGARYGAVQLLTPQAM